MEVRDALKFTISLVAARRVACDPSEAVAQRIRIASGICHPDVVYFSLDAAASSNRKVVGYGLLGLSEEMLPASAAIMGVALQSVMVLTLRVFEQSKLETTQDHKQPSD